MTPCTVIRHSLDLFRGIYWISAAIRAPGFCAAPLTSEFINFMCFQSRVMNVQVLYWLQSFYFSGLYANNWIKESQCSQLRLQGVCERSLICMYLRSNTFRRFSCLTDQTRRFQPSHLSSREKTWRPKVREDFIPSMIDKRNACLNNGAQRNSIIRLWLYAFWRSYQSFRLLHWISWQYGGKTWLMNTPCLLHWFFLFACCIMGNFTLFPCRSLSENTLSFLTAELHTESFYNCSTPAGG